MADVTVERTIAADPTTLWEMVSDVTRMGEWSPETTACKWTGAATGPAVGAKFRGSNAIGRKKWATPCTVTASVPGEVFSFEVGAGPLKGAEWTYRFEPDGDATVVTEQWTDKRAGWLKVAGKWVTGVADRASHNRESMEATLARLDEVATAD